MFFFYFASFLLNYLIFFFFCGHALFEWTAVSPPFVLEIVSYFMKDKTHEAPYEN